MKFLIDECLSPELVKIAHGSGFHQSTCVLWLGMSGAKDHVVGRIAVDQGYILVTHNTVDFLPLYNREDIHVGLVAFNTSAGIMSLELQKALMSLVIEELNGSELWNEVLEISVNQDFNVSISRYDLPRR